MGKKKFTESVQVIGEVVPDTIDKATKEKSKRTQPKEASEEEKKARASTMKTQGRKGCKIQRVNMAFSAENYEFLQVVSKLKGFNVTKFVNFVVDKYREEHIDIYEQAKKLQEGL